MNIFVQIPMRLDFLSIIVFCLRLVERLFIELMLHLLRVKQMYSQPINISHELIFCIQIVRGRIDFSKDFAVKSPLWHIFSLPPLLPTFLLSDLLASISAPTGFSQLGLSNQVNSTTVHLTNCYLPSTPKDGSMMKAPLMSNL